jgi:hypothetical protein
MRRRFLQYAWLIAVAGWACLRIFAVNTWLSKYGVNTAVFAMVEIGSSIPYGIGSARCVTSLIDHRRRAATAWGFLAAIGFISPDLYMLTAGKSMPAFTYVIIIAVVTTLGTISVIGLVRKYRQSRIL